MISEKACIFQFAYISFILSKNYLIIYKIIFNYYKLYIILNYFILNSKLKSFDVVVSLDDYMKFKTIVRFKRIESVN